MRRFIAIAFAVMLFPSIAAADAPDVREAKVDSLVAEGRRRFTAGSFDQHGPHAIVFGGRINTGQGWPPRAPKDPCARAAHFFCC